MKLADRLEEMTSAELRQFNHALLEVINLLQSFERDRNDRMCYENLIYINEIIEQVRADRLTAKR